MLLSLVETCRCCGCWLGAVQEQQCSPAGQRQQRAQHEHRLKRAASHGAAPRWQRRAHRHACQEGLEAGIKETGVGWCRWVLTKPSGGGGSTQQWQARTAVRRAARAPTSAQLLPTVLLPRAAASSRLAREASVESASRGREVGAAAAATLSLNACSSATGGRPSVLAGVTAGEAAGEGARLTSSTSSAAAMPKPLQPLRKRVQVAVDSQTLRSTQHRCGDCSCRKQDASALLSCRHHTHQPPAALGARLSPQLAAAPARSRSRTVRSLAAAAWLAMRAPEPPPQAAEGRADC